MEVFFSFCWSIDLFEVFRVVDEYFFLEFDCQYWLNQSRTKQTGYLKCFFSCRIVCNVKVEQKNVLSWFYLCCGRSSEFRCSWKISEMFVFNWVPTRLFLYGDWIGWIKDDEDESGLKWGYMSFSYNIFLQYNGSEIEFMNFKCVNDATQEKFIQLFLYELSHLNLVNWLFWRIQLFQHLRLISNFFTSFHSFLILPHFITLEG